jgi:nucleoside-diphosphate-sugar epimerase
VKNKTALKSSIPTILLTGGTGFLGSNLLKNLIPLNYKLILLKRSFSNTSRINDFIDKVITYDIDREEDLECIFRKHQIDMIIHCATSYGRREVAPLTIIAANLLLPLKLLQLGLEHNVTCFINSDTLLDKRVSHYSLSKSQFKDWLRAYSDKMACVNIALEHFYGPYDDDSKFVTYIIRHILENIENIDLTIGEQKRDFIYIDDVVDAFEKIIRYSLSVEGGFFDYEIGTNRPFKIREFVTLVKKMSENTKTHLNFGALPYRPNEIMDSQADTTAIKKLGWKPKVSLEDGLRKTIDFERRLKRS